MTVREAKELIPFLQDFVNGKTIQARDLPTGEWKDIDCKSNPVIYPYSPAVEYRLKAYNGIKVGDKVKIIASQTLLATIVAHPDPNVTLRVVERINPDRDEAGDILVDGWSFPLDKWQDFLEIVP